MDMLLITARDLLMPSPKLMLILIFFMEDITDLVTLDTITLLMDMLLITARGLLMPSPKLILIFYMEDTMELYMLDTIILPTDMLLTMARDLLMLSPMCIVDTMDLVVTVVSVDMDLDIVSTMDKQRISPH